MLFPLLIFIFNSILIRRILQNVTTNQNVQKHFPNKYLETQVLQKMHRYRK